MKLKLTLPVKGTISQNFGQNAVNYYENGGLAGHPGTDIVSFYGDVITNSIQNCNKQYIYSFLNKDNPNLMSYRAVCIIVETDDGVFEITYGHVNTITASIGNGLFGSPLATEGNTGDVFVNGVEVTEAEKLAGSHAGAHVHFQVRRLNKVKYATIHSLSTDKGDFIDGEGYHYDVPHYENGYNGCIDAMQFVGVQPNYQFMRDLDVGSIGTDVLQLQRRLVRLGLAVFMPTGFYGSQTKQAITEYQLACGISPIGRCGPLTRSSLNAQ